jgi:hypothetical protein
MVPVNFHKTNRESLAHISVHSFWINIKVNNV